MIWHLLHTSVLSFVSAESTTVDSVWVSSNIRMGNLGITDTLAERFQLIFPALILCIGAIVLQGLFKSNPLSHIPFVGTEIGGQDKRRTAYLTNAKNIYKDGYQKVRIPIE